jgi:hypothetical protein
MRIETFDANSPQHLRAFLDLPARLHRGDPAWIPPFRKAVRAQVGPDAAFRQYGEMRHVLAYQGREAVARCTAMINSRYEEALGFIGYYESTADDDASHAVLRTAVDWLKARGARTIRGPINGSTYFPYRFMTEGFEDGAFFLEPYNPRHYPAQWERFGFRSCYSYRSARVDSARFAAAVAPHHARALATGYTSRPFDPAHFDTELRLMYDLSEAIFQGSWMWRPVSFDEFRALYAGMRGILDPDLCHFLYQAEIPVGFIFGLPDLAPAIRAMNGSQSLVAKLRFLAKRRQAPAALLKTFGVLPSHRNGSLALALTYLMHEAAARKGYAQTIHALMREDNTSLRMSERFGAVPFKRYDLYELEVAAHG